MHKVNTNVTDVRNLTHINYYIHARTVDEALPTTLKIAPIATQTIGQCAVAFGTILLCISS